MGISLQDTVAPADKTKSVRQEGATNDSTSNEESRPNANKMMAAFESGRKNSEDTMVHITENKREHFRVGWLLSLIVVVLSVGGVVVYLATKWSASIVPAALEPAFSSPSTSLRTPDSSTSSPSTSSSSSSPTLAFPLPEDCDRVRNGEAVLGQESFTEHSFDMILNVTMGVQLTQIETMDLLELGIQQHFIPMLVGCPAPKRKLRRYRMLSNSNRYIVANGKALWRPELLQVRSECSFAMCLSATFNANLFLKTAEVQNSVIENLVVDIFGDDLVDSLQLESPPFVLVAIQSVISKNSSKVSSSKTELQSSVTTFAPEIPVPPTLEPSVGPTTQPSTSLPTSTPTFHPTPGPTATPTLKPSTPAPSVPPSESPSLRPSARPSISHSSQPTTTPTIRPTPGPTPTPTLQASSGPTFPPTESPTFRPTMRPSISPSSQPTKSPSFRPTIQPTILPSSRPTTTPTVRPTPAPTGIPPLRVACIGDSLTRGRDGGNPWWDTYPWRLQQLLGEDFEVHNFGRNAMTALRGMGASYVNTWQFQDSLDLKADIYLLMLGTNDARYWGEYGHKYQGDMEWIINKVRSISTESPPRIIVAMPPWVKIDGKFGVRNEVLVNGVQPAIQSLSSLGVHIVNMYDVTYNQVDMYIGDGLHLNQKGYTSLAKTWNEAITCNQNGICEAGESCATCPEDCHLEC